MGTTYDDVDYPTLPRALGHPGHIHAVARMFGVPAPPVERSRVLEIGSGDGTHLISCAVTLPDAFFTGIDLSAEATARGNKLIERVGLGNVQLIVADILTWHPPAEPFDYILVHGVYSWVPEAVRDVLMALIRRTLSPHGVACVSYNCYPAGYTRQMIWEMMKYHIGERTNPDEMIAKALELAEFLRLSRNDSIDDAADLFEKDLDIILNRQHRGVLYHDELSPVNRPMYFHQFADHARRHELRFVSEVEPHVMVNSEFPPEVGRLLQSLGQINPERREQYYDFACMRRFRQTLLTREPHAPRSQPDPEALAQLYVSGNCGTDSIDYGLDRPMTFAAGTTAIDFASPLTKAAMVVLVESRPRRYRFSELVAAALGKLDRTDATDAELGALKLDLINAWTTGVILLKGSNPHSVLTVLNRPVASPFARVELSTGTRATTLYHLNLRFGDDEGRKLVLLLDGTRTVDEIVTELYPSVPLEKNLSLAEFSDVVRRNLEILARAGLLIA